MLHACRTIRTMRETDGKLRQDWNTLVRSLTGLSSCGQPGDYLQRKNNPQSVTSEHRFSKHESKK